MSLCNWHIAGEANTPATGGLNYRQESTITESTGKPGTAGEFSTSGGAVSGKVPPDWRLTGAAVALCGLPVATSREYESAPCALAYGHKGDCKP